MRKLVYLLICLLLGVAGAGSWFYFSNKNSSPIPKDIQKSVSFPIYYPDPAKLPAGYTLDVSSFSATGGEAVVYVVKYGNNQKIVFSVQKKPPDSDLAMFYKNNIPLREDVLTLVGTAAVSVLNGREFVSLPTGGGSWVIITAPKDINHAKLIEIVKATTSKT